MNKILISILCVGLLVFSGASSVSASETDGTLTSATAYAWGENIGWINFAASESDVHVSDDGLSGYAWTANYGWINLAPGEEFGGVTNDGEGNLGGYAWSALLGPINFSGVTISDTGVFEGTSVGEGSTAGRITFDCDHCDVQTDWRPESVRSGYVPEDESEEFSDTDGRGRRNIVSFLKDFLNLDKQVVRDSNNEASSNTAIAAYTTFQLSSTTISKDVSQSGVEQNEEFLSETINNTESDSSTTSNFPWSLIFIILCTLLFYALFKIYRNK